jgi:hypothetical protein
MDGDRPFASQFEAESTYFSTAMRFNPTHDARGISDRMNKELSNGI